DRDRSRADLVREAHGLADELVHFGVVFWIAFREVGVVPEVMDAVQPVTAALVLVDDGDRVLLALLVPPVRSIPPHPQRDELLALKPEARAALLRAILDIAGVAQQLARVEPALLRRRGHEHHLAREAHRPHRALHRRDALRLEALRPGGFAFGIADRERLA